MTVFEKARVNENLVINQNANETNYHPFNYYRREGDPLRPAPTRVKNNPAWYPMRKFLLDGLRPVGKFTTPTMEGDYPDRLNDLYWEGDELMDNVVIAMKKMPAGEGRKMFTQAMKKGIESVDNPPAAFIALFEQLDRVPDWVDWDEIEAGGAYQSHLPLWVVAIAGYLPTLYTTHGYATSIPVGATGRFIREKENRIIEGLHFLTSLAEPGGLKRYSYGFECAVHVRLMHAFVRHQMYKKNEEYFDYATDGDPMSQPDTLVGAPVFGISNLLFMRAMGVPVTEKQLRSVDMLWRYTLYLMGGHESCIPKNLEESLYLLDYYIATQGKPSQFTDELNHAFLIGMGDAIIDRAPAWQKPLFKFYFRDVFGSFMWYMVGDELALETKYAKKPNFITKQIPNAAKAWAAVQTLRGSYKPNEVWNPEFHRDGAMGDFIHSLFCTKEKNKKVTFQAHDNSKAEDFGKKPVLEV